jgi:hypothetical protein
MNRALRILPAVFLMAMSVVFFGPTTSAEAGNWTWKRYRLKFWLPTGMRPTRNNSRAFIAKGKGIVLKIRAWRSRRGTSVSACRRGYRTYNIIRGKRILVRKRLSGKYSWRGQKLWRYLYMGSGRYRGSRVYWAVIGGANHRTRIRFYARMWWKKWRHRWVKSRVSRIARRIRPY